MTDTIVRRWDDFGAPQLDVNVPMSAILDAVLVNGYGNSPGLGWTKPFGVSNNVHVYRMPNGTESFFLRVDDNNYVYHSHKMAKVRSYEDMTDIDTGTGQMPLSTTTNALADHARWMYGNPTFLRRWVIIAGAGWFYFLCESYPSYSATPFPLGGWSIGGPTLHYYGRLHNVSGSDSYAVGLSRGSCYDGGLPEYHSETGFIADVSNGLFFLQRASSQIGGCCTASIATLPIAYYNSTYSLRYPNNRGLLACDSIKVMDVLYNGSNLPIEYRGDMPVLQRALHNAGSLYTAGVRSLDTITLQGITYLVVFVPRDNLQTMHLLLFALQY